MPVEVKQSFLGGIDLDSSFYNIRKDGYVDALNITRDAVAQSQDEIPTNIVGNRLVQYNKPAGTNVTIGAREDLVRNRVYEFMWNSNGFHSIIIYDNATRTRTKLIENLTDTGSIDILQFSRYKKIVHIDIIYRDDEGDLLFWTDAATAPRKVNVKHLQNGVYSVVTKSYTEIAKAPILTPLTCVYGSDSTRNSNSLRKQLFMFSGFFGYDDFEKPVFSTYSKIPLPIGYYGSDNDTITTKNNFITITIQTGDESVKLLYIAMRNNNGNIWNDFVLIASLDKVQLGIPDNSTYNFLFYNDQVYPPFDVEIDVLPLQDYVPRITNALCLPNGNVVAMGGNTEGYDNYPVGSLNVTITAANKTNSPPDADPPSITYVNTGSNSYNFTVKGSVPVGTLYKIVVLISGHPPTVITVATYTSVLGNNVNDVAGALYAYVLAHYSSYAQSYGGGATFTLNFPAGSSILQVSVVPGGSGGATISTEKTWLWDANYVYGLVYFDDKGRIIGSVATFISPTNSANDFLVTTPSFSLDGSSVQTPVVSAAINHLPPEGAVKYCWVRRRMTYADFIFYETCDYQTDADYLYFCLANIEAYKLDNSQFIYGTAPVDVTQSRIKVVAGISGGGYDGKIYTEDFEILGLVTRTLTGGSTPENDVNFIKVKKPTAPLSGAYEKNMLVMIYIPMQNPVTLTDSVFWEWGESYDIYTLSGVNYHRGMNQDQTNSQPATFTWPEGDVYFHERTMYSEILTQPFPAAANILPIMDANWSDFFASAVNDNGRGQIVDVNAKQNYFPSTVRYSLEFQQFTNINQTNRFLFNNFEDYDRSFGDIFKLYVFNRYMDVGQRFKIGSVPIFNQMSKDSQGNMLLVATDKLLNPIFYYEGDYGVSVEAPVWVVYNNSRYFFDINRGIWCRLSQDGIIPISVIYKVNSWMTQHGVLRTGNFKIYGAFDPKSNNCIFAFEQTDTDDPYTWTFDEKSNSYESKLSFHPEMMCVLGSLLITWQDGDLYTHDSDVYNNFYGVQYPSSISFVWNENSVIKKNFNAIAYQSTQKWISDTNGDIQTSMVNPQTGLQQISQLKAVDYEIQENVRYAAFLRDVNSKSDARFALCEGDYLTGTWLLTKLICQSDKATELVFLSMPYVTWQVSNRNL